MTQKDEKGKFVSKPKSEALTGAAKVQTDTSKDAHWDLNNRTPEQKAKDSGDAGGPKPYGNAPDAGMTPEEADKVLNVPKEQVTPMSSDKDADPNAVKTNVG